MKHLFCISLAFILFSSFSLSQSIIRVPQDYGNIQMAINAAANGDVVLVSEGTYMVNLRVNKKITLASLYYQDGDTSHISKTILNGSTPSHADSGSVVTFGPGTDSTSTIIGFTITGGKGNKHLSYDTDPPGPFMAGGGIDISWGGASILHNIIRNNSVTSNADSTDGGGISAVTWNVTEPNIYVIIEDNTISHNSTTSPGVSMGGGLHFWGTSGRIARNRITNNTASYNAGVMACAAAKWGIDTVIIEGNLIQGNVASVNIAGLGVDGDGNVSYIRNNVVLDNVAMGAIGGIAVGDNSYAIVEGNYIARNAGGNPGGIYFWTTNRNSIARNNIVVNNYGHGIRALYSTSAMLVNNTIVGNTGYGISAGSPATIRGMNNIVWNNGGGSISGNVYLSYSLVSGGFAGTGNINADPMFIAGDTLYRLQTTSPCINAGVQSALVGGLTLTAPSNDFLNTPRPRATGTKPDIGAVENDHPTIVQNVTRLDTIYTPAGYVDGVFTASIFIPPQSIARGIGIVLGHGLDDTPLDGLGVWCDTLAAHGYVAMTISFLELDETKYPVPVRAFKTGVEFLRRNAKRFGITTNRIAGLGISQGAIIWGETIIWDNDDKFFGTDSSIDDHINSVILLYGIYDNYKYLLSWENNIFTNYFSLNPDLRGTKGQCLSNVENISTPVLLIHASSDPTCNIAHSRMLRDSLTIYNKQYRYIEVNSNLHVFDVVYGNPKSTSFTTLGLSIKDSVLQFLDQSMLTPVRTDDCNTNPIYLALSQNYPNPFNPTTAMSYELPVASSVKLVVYDLLGHEVAVLVNEKKPAGRYSVTWDASRFSSGVYFYRLQCGQYVETKKLSLLK